MIIFLGIISVVLLAGFVIDFKNHRMSTKQMVMASLIAAISFVLSLVQFVRYPQGGAFCFNIWENSWRNSRSCIRFIIFIRWTLCNTSSAIFT